MASNSRSRLDLKEAYNHYMYEPEGVGLRTERFRAEFDAGMSAERVEQWLEAAFIQGARAMAQDTLDTLLDYGTACAGVDKDKYSLTDCFDKAHANLHIYYTQVLQDAEDDNK